jgi:transposase-like protein
MSTERTTQLPAIPPLSSSDLFAKQVAKKRWICPLCGKTARNDESQTLLRGRWNHLDCLIAAGILVSKDGFLVMANAAGEPQPRKLRT